MIFGIVGLLSPHAAPPEAGSGRHAEPENDPFAVVQPDRHGDNGSSSACELSGDADGRDSNAAIGDRARWRWGCAKWRCAWRAVWRGAQPPGGKNVVIDAPPAAHACWETLMGHPSSPAR